MPFFFRTHNSIPLRIKGFSPKSWINNRKVGLFLPVYVCFGFASTSRRTLFFLKDTPAKKYCLSDFACSVERFFFSNLFLWNFMKNLSLKMFEIVNWKKNYRATSLLKSLIPVNQSWPLKKMVKGPHETVLCPFTFRLGLRIHFKLWQFGKCDCGKNWNGVRVDKFPA